MNKKLLKLTCSAAIIFSQPLMFNNIQARELNRANKNEEVGEPKPWGVLPDANQYKYQKDELAAFVHFGMNTFTGSEWGNGQENENLFHIDHFDAEKLVKSVHDAGFKKVIVTAKHHDGFCIWPSAYTEHDTETAGYKGDVLAEISAACTKYNMDMGLYLSPWDVNSKAYGYFDKDGNPLVDTNGNPLNGMTWQEVEEKDVYDYNEYYNNQLIEILGNKKYGNNGRFVEVWMDGAKGGGANAQNYTFKKWYETIQNYEGKAAGYEADCMLFGANSHSTVYWIGNEDGLAADETWAKINVNKETDEWASDTHWQYFMKGFEKGNQWAVPECDGRITSGWFWGENKKTPKSIEQLANMYFNSVGHNATMLLNIPPNNKGTVDQEIINRVNEFGENIRETFANNLAKDATVNTSETRGNNNKFAGSNVLDENQNTYWTVNDGTTTANLTLDLGELKQFDVVSIEEAIQLGQRIKSFKVEYLDKNNEWKLMQEGKTIGSKRLVRTAPVKGSKVRITVTTSEAAPILTEVGIFKASDGFSLSNGVPSGLKEKDIADKINEDKPYGFEYGNQWTMENVGLNGTNIWANPGAELKLKFHGTKVYLMGTHDPNHGTADIYIDDKLVETIDTNAGSRSLGKCIFESKTLSDADHTLKLVVKDKAIGLETAYILDNSSKGMFEIEKTKYSLYEDSEMDVVVKRIGGSKGEASVLVQDNPGSAVQGDYYTGSTLLTFKDGETEKTVKVQTKRDPKVKGDIFFTLELVEPTNDTILGFVDHAKITIKDLDVFTKEKLQNLYNKYVSYNESSYVQGWKEFEIARNNAKQVLANVDATTEMYAKAYIALDESSKKLVSREGYSVEFPYLFPTSKDKGNILEAEFAQLENTGDANEEWKLNVSNQSWASNGKVVDSLNQNDMIHIPYVANKKGVYEFVVNYRSGDPKNALHWSEKNGKIKEGEITAGSSNSTETHTVKFNVEVVEPGPGILTFTGPEHKSPVIDKFDVILKEESLYKTNLQNKINEINSLNLQSEEYTNSSWNKLDKTIKDANDVLKNAKTQEEIDNSYDKLNKAYKALEKRADTTKAKEFLEKVKEYNANNYTQDTWNSFVEARQVVENMVKNVNDISQSQMDEALNKAIEAQVQLVYKTADYSKVEAAIEKAESLNKDDYKDFSKVEAALNAVVKDKDITEQEEVDAMAEAIEKAIAELEKKPGLTPLEPAKPIIPLTPLEPSKEVVPMTPLKPSAPIDSTKPEESTNEKVESDKQPATGVSTNTALLWMVVLGSGVVVSLNKKIKEIK